MAMQILKGRIANYKRKRGLASFVFTDDDREGLGVIAIAAGLAGLSGQAIGTAIAASAEEDADHLEFEIDGKPVKGWVWRSPFKNGDEVEVAAEWRQDHYELCAVARPEDKIVALYPHCSRGTHAHWRNAWKLWLLGTGATLYLSIAFSFLFMAFHDQGDAGLLIGIIVTCVEAIIGTLVFFLYGGRPIFWAALAIIAAGVWRNFGAGMGEIVLRIGVPVALITLALALLITWDLARKWMPFVRLSEKAFRAFGWDKPASVDLVKRSKEGMKGDEPPEYGVFYFRY